MGWVQ